MAKYKSDEGFYETGGDGRDDETFHEEILDNKEADLTARRQSARDLINQGEDRDVVLAMYNLTRDDLR